MHFADKCGQDASQGLIGADIQVGAPYEILPQRHIEKWPRSLAHALILRIGDHTDDSCPSALHLKSTADRILTCPVARNHGSIHDGDQRRVLVIGARKFPAGEKGDSQRREIHRTHLVVFHGRLFFQRRLVAVHNDRRGRVRGVAQRRHAGESGGLYAWQRI